MLPLRLLIEDFQIHKKTEIDFTKFNSALILGSKVSDENEASGIGKTTIFTAIEYVLYNEYQRRLVDKIVRKGADKARVTLDADFNGTIYRIQRTRYLKNKTTELLLFKKENDKFIPLDGVRTGDTEKELKKLIKVNYTTFKNVHLFSQGDLSGLASAKDSKTRFSLLEEAAELIDYTNLETLTKKNISQTLIKN